MGSLRIHLVPSNSRSCRNSLETGGIAGNDASSLASLPHGRLRLNSSGRRAMKNVPQAAIVFPGCGTVFARQERDPGLRTQFIPFQLETNDALPADNPRLHNHLFRATSQAIQSGELTKRANKSIDRSRCHVFRCEALSNRGSCTIAVANSFPLSANSIHLDCEGTQTTLQCRKMLVASRNQSRGCHPGAAAESRGIERCVAKLVG